MSETKRLLDRQSDQDYRSEQSEQSDTVKLSTIRHRTSLIDPGASTSTSSSNTKYGTLPSSMGIRQSLLVKNYPQSFFTKKQFAIAMIALLVFVAAVAVTLSLGLPRLRQKREEYFAAAFFQSPYQELMSTGNAILVSGYDYDNCSSMASNVLVGGNVIDAALAAMLCAQLTTPHLVGLDSGFTLMYYSYQNKSAFSVEAPEQRITVNGTSVSLPRLYESAKMVHNRFGQRNWNDIVEPVVQLAVDGVPVGKHLADQLEKNQQTLERNMQSIGNLFTKMLNTSDAIDGNKRSPLTQNDLYHNFVLAQTLELMLRNDTEAMFAGEIGKFLLDDINKVLGNRLKHLTSEELAEYLDSNRLNLIVMNPLMNVTLFNKSMTLLTSSNKDVSGGYTLAELFTLFEHLLSDRDSEVNLCNAESRTVSEGAFEFHYLIESLKFGSSTILRAINGSELDELSQSDKTYEIENKIIQSDLNHVNEHEPDYYNLNLTPEVKEQSKLVFESNNGNQIVVIVFDDVSGDVAVLTTNRARSLFDGKKVYSSLTGIVLDVIDEDKYQPTPILCPVLLINSNTHQVEVATGATGNLYPAISAMFQVLYKSLLDCEDLKIATDESRFFYDPIDQVIKYEPELPQAYHDMLMKLFDYYNLNPIESNWVRPSVASVVRVKSGPQLENNMLHSMLDYRQGGSSVTYEADTKTSNTLSQINNPNRNVITENSVDVNTKIETNTNVSPSTNANTNVSPATNTNTNVNPPTNTIANVNPPTNTIANVSPPTNTNTNVSPPTNTNTNVSLSTNTNTNVSLPTNTNANVNPPTNANISVSSPISITL